MTPRRLPIALLPLALALALALAACGVNPPATASPTASPPASPPSATPQPTAPAPTAEPTAEPTTTPTPTVTFDPAVVPDAELASSITAVVPGGDGLVAIGWDGAFGSILWTSADGREWRDATPDGFQSIGMASVIQLSDGRLLGVGRGDTINVDAEVAAAYLSDDGLTWRPSAGEDLRGQMIDVVETDDGLFVVGGVPGADAAGVWRSTDGGETWERTGDDLPGAFFWSIAEGGPGLVIAGWRRNPDPYAAVWTSADAGETWQLAGDPEGADLAEGTDILATDSGALIMVGGSFVEEGASIWRSTDGATWTRAEVQGDLTDASVRSVVSTPIGHLAVGAIGMDAAAWLSTDDGATWAPFGDPVAEAYFHDAIVTDGGLLLVGATQSGTLETGIDARAMLWTADLAD